MNLSKSVRRWQLLTLVIAICAASTGEGSTKSKPLDSGKPGTLTQQGGGRGARAELIAKQVELAKLAPRRFERNSDRLILFHGPR